MNKYQEAYDILFDGLLTMPQDISENEKKLIFKSMNLIEEACDKAKKYDERETILPLKIEMNEHNAIDELCPICNNSIQKWDKYCSKCGRRMRVV